MTLQQLRYLIAVADSGSINSAARANFVSQSTVSVAIKDLEQEMGVTIFNRSNKGIALTSDGIELLSYARQVVEQADLMVERYAGSEDDSAQRRLSIASQHYAFVVKAFTNFLEGRETAAYEYTLRETRTIDIIRDVAEFRSDLGILYTSAYNERLLTRRFDEDSLRFVSLLHVKPHVFVRAGHPLSRRGKVRVSDLAEYPCYTFEQGPEASLYLSEEPLSSGVSTRRVVVSDRATMTSLLKSGEGYLVSSGILSEEMGTDVVSIPLVSDEVMNVGYIVHRERRLSGLAKAYLAELRKVIAGMEGDGLEATPAPEDE